MSHVTQKTFSLFQTFVVLPSYSVMSSPSPQRQDSLSWTIIQGKRPGVSFAEAPTDLSWYLQALLELASYVGWFTLNFGYGVSSTQTGPE